MSKLRVHTSGGYSVVPDGNNLRYWTGAGYLIAKEGRYWNGSSYVPFWTRSSPLTATFFPTMTTNLRWSGSSPQYDGPATHANDTLADLFIGRYGGSFPYHYTSLLQFRGPSQEGHGTLTEIIAERPVVKEANIRLYRVSGGWNAPAGRLRIGSWTQQFAETLPPTHLDGRYHDWDPHTANDVYGWLHGQNRVFPVYPQIVWDMAFGNSMMISEVTSEYMSPGGTSGAYSRIAGVGSLNPNIIPLLAVAFDVV